MTSPQNPNDLEKFSCKNPCGKRKRENAYCYKCKKFNKRKDKDTKR